MDTFRRTIKSRCSPDPTAHASESVRAPQSDVCIAILGGLENWHITLESQHNLAGTLDYDVRGLVRDQTYFTHQSLVWTQGIPVHCRRWSARLPRTACQQRNTENYEE
jgi:hypothetical protein